MSKTNDLLESTQAAQPCPKCGSRHENVAYDTGKDMVRHKCATCGYVQWVLPLDAAVKQAALAAMAQGGKK